VVGSRECGQEVDHVDIDVVLVHRICLDPDDRGLCRDALRRTFDAPPVMNFMTFTLSQPSVEAMTSRRDEEAGAH
jgi:hypothetical protein